MGAVVLRGSKAAAHFQRWLRPPHRAKTAVGHRTWCPSGTQVCAWVIDFKGMWGGGAISAGGGLGGPESPGGLVEARLRAPASPREPISAKAGGGAAEDAGVGRRGRGEAGAAP